jgi:hypothetical protein
MAHKKKHRPAPVPPGNRPAGGPAETDTVKESGHGGGSAPFQDQDAKRRLGGFSGTAEHPRQQPTPVNDGQQHSR